MIFIKIKLSDKTDEIINSDYIVELIKGEEYDDENKSFLNSYSIVLKNEHPRKISEYVYNQIIEKIKGVTL